MPLATAQSPLLTPNEAAAWLRSRERTLEHWRYQRTGPAFVRVGRHAIKGKIAHREGHLRRCSSNHEGGRA